MINLKKSYRECQRLNTLTKVYEIIDFKDLKMGDTFKLIDHCYDGKPPYQTGAVEYVCSTDAYKNKNGIYTVDVEDDK